MTIYFVLGFGFGTVGAKLGELLAEIICAHLQITLNEHLGIYCLLTLICAISAALLGVTIFAL